MSSNQPFLRNIELLIGPLTEDAGGGNVNQAFRIFSSGDRNGLRVKFSVKKTMLGPPNASVIEIYNLSRQSRESIARSLAKVRLQVGYANTGLSLLTQGAIKSVVTERRGADLVTSLVMYDGWGGQIKGYTNEAFAPNQSISSVVEKVAKQMPGVNIGEIDVDGFIGLGGYAVSDRSADVLDRLAGQYGFSWSIQNGTFQAVQDTRALRKVVEISNKQRNLIKAVPVLNGVEQIRTAVEINAIINPRVLPGHQIKLQSDLNPRLNGFYKVHEVDFDGDSGDQSWNMTIRSLEIGG